MRTTVETDAAEAVRSASPTGSGKIVERMEQDLGVAAGGTTPDYRVTCEVVYCLGSCGLAPVAVVDEQTIGKLAPEKMSAILKGLE